MQPARRVYSAPFDFRLAMHTAAELVDIGANLTHESFANDLSEVLNAARNEGVAHLVVTGASPRASEEALTIARARQLVCTAGVHPHHAEETTADVITRFGELLAEPEVRAVGETGLDYFRDLSPRAQQIQSFEAHIELAIEHGLPMFLHERDAYPDFADVIRPYRDQLDKVVVHCFTGSAEALYAYLDLDCHIGLTGWVCDERRGTHLAPLIKDIPEARLMIETDAPYLMPRTIRPKPKSRRNEPKYLPWVCRFIAETLEVPFETVARRTTANAKAFFSL